MLIRGRNSPRSWLIPGLQLSTQAGDGGQARLHLEALHGAVHTQEELVEVAGLQFSVSVSVRYQNIARPRLVRTTFTKNVLVYQMEQTPRPDPVLLPCYESDQDGRLESPDA